MQLTLNSLTALRITRAIRSGKAGGDLWKRCGFVPPDPSPSRRWTRKRIETGLAFLGELVIPSERRPLHVLCDSMGSRLQTRGVSCTYRLGTYPDDTFVDLGDGIAMAGPELMYVELARVMDPVAHLLLGMELCGRFSRDAMRPHDGPATYDVEPVTTVEKLRAFAQEAHWIRGAERALAAIDRIVENAWSPMEALLATLIVLPADELGYDLWPVSLNPHKELDERLSRLSDVESRVPDVLFTGTKVGLNYDGEDHFRLRDIAMAAVRADRNPGDSSFARELDGALAEARQRIVADKRRDRDLMAMGLTVFSVTKEDLEEEGGLDRVMGQAIEAIECEGMRDLTAQRRMMQNKSRTAARQELIWALMPGPHSAVARERLEERRVALANTHEFEFTFETDEGNIRAVSLMEL